MSDDEPTTQPETLTAIFKRLGIDTSQVYDRTGTEHQEIVAATREAVWHRACLAGQCRYGASVGVRDANPPAVDSTTTCGGYHGTQGLETPATGSGPFVTVWRWRPCGRHQEWQQRRRDWLREEAQRGESKKPGLVTYRKPAAQ